jgi:hypothetical protein
MIPPRDRMRIPPATDVRDYVRHLGVRRTLLRGAYVLANQVVALSIFDCVRLRPEDLVADAVVESGAFQGRFAHPSELGRLANDLDGVGQRVLGEARERGDSCYVVFDGPRLANISFYADRPVAILNDLMVHFQAPWWYMHGAYTPTAYRGRRLHAVGIRGAARELFDRGVSGFVGVYERTNYRSMVSALRMGWRPCGTLYRLRIGSWMRLGHSADARAVGMRLEPRGAEDRA